MPYDFVAWHRAYVPHVAAIVLPPVPSGAPGYRSVSYPALVVPIPAGESYDLLRVEARLQVEAPVLDSPQGRPTDALAFAELRLLAPGAPVPASAGIEPPGVPFGVIGGEDLGPGIHRRYYTAHLFGTIDAAMFGGPISGGASVVCWIRPETDGAQAPQRLVLPASMRYSLMEVSCYSWRDPPIPTRS